MEVTTHWNVTEDGKYVVAERELPPSGMIIRWIFAVEELQKIVAMAEGKQSPANHNPQVIDQN